MQLRIRGKADKGLVTRLLPIAAHDFDKRMGLRLQVKQPCMRGTGVSAQLLVSMLIIIMHIIPLDAVRKTD